MLGDIVKPKFGGLIFINGSEGEISFTIIGRALIASFNLSISKKVNAPIIATNEVYYLHKDMSEAHDALLCIGSKKYINDSLSHVAPTRILNIGNTKKVLLSDFINAIEKRLGKKANKNFLPMQKGDLHSTLSDTKL